MIKITYGELALIAQAERSRQKKLIVRLEKYGSEVLHKNQ